MTADCLRTDRDLTGSGAAAVRRNGDRTCRPVRHAAVAVSQRSLNLSQTASERRRPERQLHGSASGRPVPDSRYRGCVRAAGPQQQRCRRIAAHSVLKSGSNRLCRRSTPILARSSRNGPVGAVSLATLGGKTAVRPVNDPIIPRVSAAHPRGEWPRGALDRAAHCHPGYHWLTPPQEGH